MSRPSPEEVEDFLRETYEMDTNYWMEERGIEMKSSKASIADRLLQLRAEVSYKCEGDSSQAELWRDAFYAINTALNLATAAESTRTERFAVVFNLEQIWNWRWQAYFHGKSAPLMEVVPGNTRPARSLEWGSAEDAKKALLSDPRFAGMELKFIVHPSIATKPPACQPESDPRPVMLADPFADE